MDFSFERGNQIQISHDTKLLALHGFMCFKLSSHSLCTWNSSIEFIIEFKAFTSKRQKEVEHVCI